MPRRTFADRDSDSCCASAAMMVISTSPLASSVLMFSFSKNTAIFISFSFRVYLRQSTVLRENRLIDFVIIMSMRPASQSAIIRLKASRFAVRVPEMPLSAYTSTISHSGFPLM